MKEVFEKGPDDQSSAHEHRDFHPFTARSGPHEYSGGDTNSEDVQKRISDVPCLAELQRK